MFLKKGGNLASVVTSTDKSGKNIVSKELCEKNPAKHLHPWVFIFAMVPSYPGQMKRFKF